MAYNAGMKKKIFLWLFLFVLTACRPAAATPDWQTAVQHGVSATLTALPAPTLTAPESSPCPTLMPTPHVDLHNRFCEYDFCLGHPAETYFFDALMVKDTRSASNYVYGVLMTYQPNFFMQFNWSLLSGEPDPYEMLAVTAGDDVIDLNALDVQQIEGWVVTMAPVLKTASPDTLPYGLVASWTCGDREFGWKVYTTADNQISGLLQTTLSRFDCVEP